jgi:hypothetical protein
MTPDQAIKHFGTQRAVADACDVTPAAVSLWVSWGKIPAARQYQLHVMSGGKLPIEARKKATA